MILIHFKNKYYYEHEYIYFNKIIKIEDMLNNDEPLSDIQSIIFEINKTNNIFINNTTNTQCPIMQLLTSSINKINKLESMIPKKNNFHAGCTPVDTSIKTVINMSYVKYILKYGVPFDGVFLPELLKV